MYNFIKITLAVASLAGMSLSALPASAGETVGIHVGDLGVTVGNGHYYDRSHRRHAYDYPTDWKSYNHPSPGIAAIRNGTASNTPTGIATKAESFAVEARSTMRGAGFRCLFPPDRAETLITGNQ